MTNHERIIRTDSSSSHTHTEHITQLHAFSHELRENRNFGLLLYSTQLACDGCDGGEWCIESTNYTLGWRTRKKCTDWIRVDGNWFPNGQSVASAHKRVVFTSLKRPLNWKWIVFTILRCIPVISAISRCLSQLWLIRVLQYSGRFGNRNQLHHSRIEMKSNFRRLT